MHPFLNNEITGEKFENLNLNGEAFENLVFQDVTFDNCVFGECAFARCLFDDCHFHNTDLSLAKFPRSRFKKVAFEGCRLLGINWSSADWEAKSLLANQSLTFKACLLDHSIFIGLKLDKTIFKDCQARHLDFESASLRQADFAGTDLDQTRFVHCDLTRANFVGARNYQINAAENTLHQARFTLPEAVALLYSLDIILEE